MGCGFKELFHFSFPLISGHSPFIFLVYSSCTVPSLCGTSELSADVAGRWETGMVSLLNVLCSCPPGKSHPSSVGCQCGTNHSGMAFGAPRVWGWWIPGCGVWNLQVVAAFPPEISGLHYKMFTLKKEVGFLILLSFKIFFIWQHLWADCLEQFEVLGTDYSLVAVCFKVS